LALNQQYDVISRKTTPAIQKLKLAASSTASILEATSCEKMFQRELESAAVGFANVITNL